MLACAGDCDFLVVSLNFFFLVNKNVVNHSHGQIQRWGGGTGREGAGRGGGKWGEMGREAGREGEGRGEREGEGSKERGGGKRGERAREAGIGYPLSTPTEVGTGGLDIPLELPDY